jgi:hypothetical protein
MDRKSPKTASQKGQRRGNRISTHSSNSRFDFFKELSPLFTAVSSRIDRPDEENRLFLRTLRTICATSALWPQGYKAFLHV